MRFLMDFMWTRPNAKNSEAPLSRLHSPNRLSRAVCPLEERPVKHSIPEEKAENLATKLSDVMLDYFPNLDRKVVSQMASKCVQDRVQITEHVEMVLIFSGYLTIRNQTYDPKREKNKIGSLGKQWSSFLYTLCAYR